MKKIIGEAQEGERWYITTARGALFLFTATVLLVLFTLVSNI